ncbi:MAG: tRNA guanosine(34) transglycosylase Tgt [Aquificaceae bacterium]|nr:tRNA guanosine(34) transglycosylase Tgt [Aquificaceae bacterium]MDW8237603.1 tRNA guanosine(34) transglycosylase Tgt [Aquificaceae bacterium]
MVKFELYAQSSLARAGVLKTDLGEVLTPVFMPVGTQGTIKAITWRDIKELGFKLVLANTYHLYLRPGIDVIKSFGGLNRFVGFDGPILTDSGGFQVFSLSRRRRGFESRVRVLEEGVEFRDHLAGDLHLFTPERVIELQRVFGSRIVMPLDVCVEYGASKEEVKEGVMKTIRWLDRSLRAKLEPTQALFGIIQGGVFKDLRRESALMSLERDLPGYAIGGLSVGESQEEMLESAFVVCELIPKEKPRYLMGVGMPEDVLKAIGLGVDMFDCVAPTRMARTGTLFTSFGRLNIRNAIFAKDERPVDSLCDCYTCQNFSRAYLRHLFNSEEITAYILATIHNLRFYKRLMDGAREAIISNSFEKFQAETLQKLQYKEGIFIS